jgi:flagellar biosynthesis/type III secretory pathway chaperone
MLTDIDIARTEELLAILRREHEALRAGNVEQLEELVRAKRAAVSHFEQLTATSALQDTGSPADAARRTRLAALAAECRRQNDINGGMVEAGLRHVRGVLGVLRGQGPDTGVYTRHGDSTASDFSSRPLAKA